MKYIIKMNNLYLSEMIINSNRNGNFHYHLIWTDLREEAITSEYSIIVGIFFILKEISIDPNNVLIERS